MKQIILIALTLVASVGMAQTKTDTTQHSPAFHLIRHELPDSLTTSSDSATISGTLALSNWSITAARWPRLYTVNWEKVKTFADLKLILEGINISVSESAPTFKKIKKYLIESK